MHHHIHHHIRHQQSSGRNDGAILVIAIGVLTLLAILGATFANLMRLEKQATKNYLDSQEVDLINDSALEAVIAELRGADNWRSFTPYRIPWLYKLLKVDDLAHGLEPLDSENVRDWEVISERQKQKYRYKAKVIDTSAQININGKQDTLGRILDNLALAIVRSTRLKASNQNPLYTGPNQTGELLKGIQIIQFRNKLEGNRFRSKTQLRELIGQTNFEIIKDFITVESYVDPYTYKPDDGLDEIVELGQGTSAGGRGLGGGNLLSTNPVEALSAHISPEPRSPININTAPEEVLIACLQGLGCRRPFPYSNLIYAPVDQGSEAVPVPGKEERENVCPRAVWVYSDRRGAGMTYDKARNLAQRIISQRKTAPFMTWSTGDRSQGGGFAEFINSLEDSFFDSPENAFVVDPRGSPRDSRLDNEIRRGGSQDMYRLWQKGHPQVERTFRANAGLPFHTQNAFYYDMVKSMIIANANPNSRINRYNPDAPAFLAVDKSDLVRLEQNGTPRKAHTTEFCFDTNGIYEVTTLGEIAEVTGNRPDGTPQFRSAYRKPLRTVVKVFEVLRHTNQFHFEKTFTTGDHSSKNNRRYVVTCPDPMIALTEAVSAGSRRDGYVKLAGYNDGRRALLPPTSRFQTLRTPEAIMSVLTFQDRDDQSFAQLRRLTSVASKQTLDELRKVLWFGYSRKGGVYRASYTKDMLISAGLGALNQFEPNVDTEQLGTDLYPDGFHQSMYTSTHVGARPLHLIAHERIGTSLKGGNAAQVGAGMRHNEAGNVPYYTGGMAFWVKFEFNGDDPIFSGLIGCTQVIEDVGQNPKDSEGTQFYIYKDTDAKLKIVRMYYHQAYPQPAGEGEDSGSDFANLWPPSNAGDDSSGGAGGGAGAPGQNPILEHLDPKKPIARTDYYIDVRNFRAHEWHHLAVDWNDEAPGSPLKVYIDFQEVAERSFVIRQAEISETPTAWVRLNCRRPHDELFVGGFIRNQKVADSGVFKWFTNTTSTSATGRGVQVIEPSVKRILANATIDELITYQGGFTGVRSYYVQGGPPGYFSNRDGEYANVFEVPLPPEVDYVTLRSFDWTVYYPTTFTGRDNLILRVLNTPLTCQVFPGRDNIPAFNAPWSPGLRNTTNPVANRVLARRQGQMPGSNADLVYQFKLPPGKVQAGPLAGGAVQTPILDDVTLTYFLPDPKILLQEEAEERPLRPETPARGRAR